MSGTSLGATFNVGTGDEDAVPDGDTGMGVIGGDLLVRIGVWTPGSEKVSSVTAVTAVTLLPPGLTGVS